MTTYIKITRDEIIALIEKHYKIKESKFMKIRSCEHDSEVIEDFEYVEGELIKEK